jgi:hypothetical protein
LQALEIDIIKIAGKKRRAVAMARKLYRKLKKGGRGKARMPQQHISPENLWGGVNFQFILTNRGA